MTKTTLKLPAKVSNEVAAGVSELYQRFNCDYCQEDIPGLRIKCAECSDFDLCLECFACGAQTGKSKHKNSHKYLFMNNGGFSIFPPSSSMYESRPNKRISGAEGRPIWNAREEMRLLDAVEQYGYGNWKDIASHVETKNPEQSKEEYIRQYIYGSVGKHTWREELRGFAVDHTQAADRGPLSPTLTSKLPPICVSSQEALLLGYMPHRDDFEDFDRETEMLVAQIADKSSEDDDLDVALKLAQCDIYERRLREQVRRKRVARDYQLVARFYRENPIVQIGFGAKVSPQKISSQIKMVQKGDGPKKELIESLKSFNQFMTAQEFHQFVNTLCVEKELKVRTKELLKYREHGLTKQSQMVPFEQLRFRREIRLKRLAKLKTGTGGSGNCTPIPAVPSRFLPQPGDYSLKAIIDPDYEEKSGQNLTLGRYKKRQKKTLWSRKKEKTGRRLLLQKHSCIITFADKRRDSSDSNE